MRHAARRLLLLAIIAAPAAQAAADQHAITNDGDFADWSAVEPVHVDPSTDGAVIDFRRFWLADDARFLFIRFETGANIDLSEPNPIRLYLDTDADSSTGLAVGGIGAELEWRFGQRTGVFHAASPHPVSHASIRFRAAPTLTVRDYELAIGRDTMPNGVDPLFRGPAVRILLTDGSSGDRLPDAGQTLTYTLDQGSPVPPVEPIPLERISSGHLRIATYNVQRDALFDPARQPGFRRQITAVAPDILLFQEIYDHSPEDTAQLITQWLPHEPGRPWHAAGNHDCIVVSRLPVLQRWPLDDNLAVLLDAAEPWQTQLLVINAHPPCCANDAGRQAEIDRIMALVRDARTPGGELDLPPRTPIVVGGDMNLVGLAQQLDTLRTGDIVDEKTHGPDFAPDWDSSPLTSITPRQAEKRMSYTWRSDGQSYWPGQLDYLLYSDSVLRAARSFVLFTPEMSAANRQKWGLEQGDSLASDHLLFCADFELLRKSPAASGPGGPVEPQGAASQPAPQP